MNYYPFHLGDYATHTAHLEPMEDLAYRRMLDLYYLREAPLPPELQEVARLIRMRQHQAEVEAVLREFFTLTEDGWRHARCDEEIARMTDKQAKARASAAASVNARRANAQRTLNERSTDVELPTPTPTPSKEVVSNETTTAPRKRGAATVRDMPDDVSEQVWSDFLAHRKAKKAPVTPTVIDNFRDEARKAGISLEDALRTCCARGWQGFKAEWLEPKPMPAMATRRVAVPADKAARDAEAMRLLGFTDGAVIDVEVP